MKLTGGRLERTTMIEGQPESNNQTAQVCDKAKHICDKVTRSFRLPPSQKLKSSNFPLPRSTMSAKNALQEHFQKLGKPLPMYTTVRKGGSDHTPRFLSTVILANGDKFRGSGSNKKKAELRAAEKAVKVTIPQKSLSRQPLSSGPPPGLTKMGPDEATWRRTAVLPFKPKGKVTEYEKTGIFIDVENQHAMVEKLLKQIGFCSGIEIMAFASTDHPSLRKLREFHSSILQIVEVPCTRKDGADVGLTLSVGISLIQKDYQNIIIVTNDHFGDALAECVSKINQIRDLKGTAPQATCCRSLESIFRAIG